MQYIRGKLKGVKDKVAKILGGDTGKKTITMPDGGRVTYAGISWLSQRADLYQKNFTRLGTAAIRSNLSRHQSLAMKTLCRDHYLQILLESGTYTFDHIFLIRNPYGEAPLAALALFQTSDPCCVRVTIEGRHDTGDDVYVLPPARLHRVPILGLYAQYRNTVHLELLDDKGNILKEHIFPVVTKKMPSDLADVIHVEKRTEHPAFKKIMLSGGLDIRTVAYDEVGDIRYYLRQQVKGYGIFPLAGGHFLFMEKRVSRPTFSNPTAAQSHDMDYLGRVYKTYFSEAGIHHTVEEKTPGGNLLAGSGTMEGHTEDLVAEIDRETGKVVYSLRMDQIFDDTYIDWIDWAHVNSAAYYEEEDALLISLRNLHSVICVDYTTKELRWLFAPTVFWKGTAMKSKLLQPVGDVPWSYQQHAAFFLDREEGEDPDIRRMIVYDNHWVGRRKAKKFDKDTLSYVSIYEINEKEMTVRLDRRFGHRKSKIRSNGIYCPRERRVYAMAGMFATPLDEEYLGAVYEYDYDTGECLGETYVKPGFFRAYEFAPDAAALTEPIQYDPKTEDYFCGDLKRPVRLSDEEAEEVKNAKYKRVLYSSEDLFLEEDVLFVWGVDHHVKKICLAGKRNTYVTSFEDTHQTMEIFVNAKYHVCTWLDELPPDHYKLILKVDDQYQNTGKWIEKI